MTAMKNEWFMFIQIAFWSQNVFRTFKKWCTPGHVHVLAGRPRASVTAECGSPGSNLLVNTRTPSRPFVPPYQGNSFLLQVDNFTRRRPSVSQ